jgi:hypothetical protein
MIASTKTSVRPDLKCWVLLPLLLASYSISSHAFSKASRPITISCAFARTSGLITISSSTCLRPVVTLSGYTRPENSDANERQKQSEQRRVPPYPKIGDIVRYYDLDGGQLKGQVLVGKIVYISPKQKKENAEEKEWVVDLCELDYIGSGYYAEYSSRTASKKRTARDLREVAPILAASYVRSEDAYKVPLTSDSNNKEVPRVSFEKYKLEGYEGPKTNLIISDQILQSDFKRYEELKVSQRICMIMTKS